MIVVTFVLRRTIEQTAEMTVEAQSMAKAILKISDLEADLVWSDSDIFPIEVAGIKSKESK